MGSTTTTWVIGKTDTKGENTFYNEYRGRWYVHQKIADLVAQGFDDDLQRIAHTLRTPSGDVGHALPVTITGHILAENPEYIEFLAMSEGWA